MVYEVCYYFTLCLYQVFGLLYMVDIFWTFATLYHSVFFRFVKLFKRLQAKRSKKFASMDMPGSHKQTTLWLIVMKVKVIEHDPWNSVGYIWVKVYIIGGIYCFFCPPLELLVGTSKSMVATLQYLLPYLTLSEFRENLETWRIFLKIENFPYLLEFPNKTILNIEM